MKRLILSLIIALLTIGLYAQKKDAAKGEPKENIKVVYEKTFDEPIVDVIFDTATVSIEEAKRMGWKDEAFTSEEKFLLYKRKRSIFIFLLKINIFL